MAYAVTPVANVGSMIERAVVAYLRAAFGTEAASVNFYFSNDWKTRVTPLYDVLAHKSSETVPHTRNETYIVRIEAKWRGNNEAGQENPDANWTAINEFIGVGMAAMSQSDNGQDYSYTAAQITAAGRALATTGTAQEQANHADMANFTCTYVEYKGAQRAESDGQTFFIKEIRNFEIRACAANVD